MRASMSDMLREIADALDAGCYGEIEVGAVVFDAYDDNQPMMAFSLGGDGNPLLGAMLMMACGTSIMRQIEECGPSQVRH